MNRLIQLPKIYEEGLFLIYTRHINNRSCSEHRYMAFLNEVSRWEHGKGCDVQQWGFFSLSCMKCLKRRMIWMECVLMFGA